MFTYEFIFCSDKDFFEPLLVKNKFAQDQASYSYDMMRKNLSILVDALLDYYKSKFGIDLSQKHQGKHAFTDVDRLIQTEGAITVANCEPMMQFFAHIFAILLNHENLK